MEQSANSIHGNHSSKEYFFLGFICFTTLPSSFISVSNISFDFLNAYIRILGDNHRFDDPDFEPISSWSYYYSMRYWEKSFSSECRAPLKKITGGDDDIDLGNRLKRALDLLVGENGILAMNKLSFVLVNDDDPYYRCPRCGRVHLHRYG